MDTFGYRAYLATALTGLRPEERREVFDLSDLIERTCSGSGISLYQPRLATDPVKNAQVQAREVYLTDRERVVTSDLIVALCTQPSYGMGMEIQLASGAGVPILLLFKKGFGLSKMVTGSLGHSHAIDFTDGLDLAERLLSTFESIKPHLERRRRSIDHIQGETFPSRLKDVRERSNYSPETLAAVSGISQARIEDLELRDEKVSQPTVSEVRQLVNSLGVHASYLLGETPPISDPVALSSIKNLKLLALDKDLRYAVYDKLRSDYLASRKQIGFVVKTRDSVVLSEEDWAKRYEALLSTGRDNALALFE